MRPKLESQELISEIVKSACAQHLLKSGRAFALWAPKRNSTCAAKLSIFSENPG
jgi:hypothetical protein